MPLQIRRGTNSQRLAMTEPLAAGELLYTTDTGSLYIGNGTQLGGVPLSNLTPADIKDLSASIFQAGVHSGISFNYNNVTKTMDAIVEPDLSNYAGTIRADGFQGNLIAEDSTLVFNSVDGSLNLDGTVQGDIIPDDNATYDIGSSTFRFKDIYLSGSSIHLGNAVITAAGSVVDLPAGSLVGGNPIGGGGGSGVISGMNYNINIIGDDSTLILNAASRSINAQGGVTSSLFSGPLQGNVTGNLTGTHTGNVLASDASTIINHNTKTVTAAGGFLGPLTGTVNGYVTGDLKGSVFGQDSSMLIDGTGSKIVGTINSETAAVTNYTGKTIVLQGTDGFGVKAGIRINTDGDLNDGYDLFTINGAKNSSDGTLVTFIRSRGTLNSPAALQTGDVVNALAWLGADGVDAPALMCTLRVSVENTPVDGYIPSKMDFAFWNGSGFDSVLAFDGVNKILNLHSGSVVTAGGGSGQVNVGGGVVNYLKVKVGNTEYGLPLYGLNP